MENKKEMMTNISKEEWEKFKKNDIEFKKNVLETLDSILEILKRDIEK